MSKRLVSTVTVVDKIDADTAASAAVKKAEKRYREGFDAEKAHMLRQLGAEGCGF